MLLDYSLPGANGLELIKQLGSNGITVPPFIMVTGRGDEAVAVAVMKAGALDYLVKTSDFLENLLPAARKALEKIRLTKELAAARLSTVKNLRLYTFLAQVNQAAAEKKDRKALLQAACDIAVNTGGMKMAWVGQPDRDIDRVMPLYQAGFVDGYLDQIRVSLKPGDPNSKGPTGTAAATGKISTSTDIATDAIIAPWREKALARGYRSSAAIPLLEGGRLTALLTLYSPEPSFFTGEELKLLEEIKGDISLALDALAAEEQRAAAQAALERTAAQLSHVMETNPVILFSMRETGDRLVIQWVSGNVQAMTGYEPAEILAPGWWEGNLHPLDKDWAIAEQKKMTGGQVTHDFRFRKKDGNYFWAHAQFKKTSTDSGEIIASWTDISPLKESELRFNELFEKAPVGYQSLDAAGRLLAVNDIWTATFGYTKAEALGRNIAEFLLPADRQAFMERFPKFKTQGWTTGSEFEIRSKDGATRRLAFSGRIAYNPDGSFKATHCVFIDKTETWKAQRQTDLLSHAIKASFNEIYLFDPATYKFIFVNYGALKNLGYAPEEMENLAPWDLKKEFTEASFRAKTAPLLRGEGETLAFETVHTRKDGTTYPVAVHLQYVKSDSPVFLAVITDITQRKRAEKLLEEIAGMQRVEALGALAGGIAHDFNNMLTGIMANLSLLEAKANCDPASLEILKDTTEAARNARGLTAQLMAFAKGGQPVKKEFCLEQALADIFKLATAGTKAACEFSVPENLWSVEGDENQLKQAVNNVLVNALQAMPAGGKLTLRAENAGGPELTGLAGKDCVKLTVTDTGIGIPAQYLGRIFDPYFTTKSRGHGLGLSMVWSVIKNHGGHIQASSEPGKGTAFEIYLLSTGRCLQKTREQARPVQKGSGRVLVLEDEEIVSQAVKRMLEQLGYSCRLTADGKETLRAYAEAKAAGRPFDIIMLDLTIPGGLGGKEAVLQLRKIAPKAKVIVSSGYSDEAVMADYKAYGFDAVLPKPYRYEDLAETLARLLKE